MNFHPPRSWTLTCLALALGATVLSACVPVAVVGGAVGAGTLVATGDRRSSETQQADNTLEAQGRDQIVQALGGRGHVNLASYYRKLLLTGEVPTEQDRQMVESIARALPGMQGVVNEVAVMPNSSTLDRSNDALITSKVRTRLVNQNGVPSNSIKIVTERGTTYLMGRLTASETALATDAASQTEGVLRLVRVIDQIAEAPGGSAGVFTSAGGAPTDSQGRALPTAAEQAGALNTGAVSTGAAGSAIGAAAMGNATGSALGSSVSNATSAVGSQVNSATSAASSAVGSAVQDASGVVTQPVIQSPIIQQPSSVPVQVQTLPAIK